MTERTTQADPAPDRAANSAGPADTAAAARGSRPRRRRWRRGLVAGVVGLVLVGGLVTYDTRDTSPPEPELAEPVDPASGDVSAFPSPGTVTVSARTELSFRGPTDLDGLTVTGTQTGEHDGTFVEHSDGDGVSWRPDEPFEPGEEITVSTAMAVRGADDGEYTLTVAQPAERPALEEPPVSRAVLNAETSEGEVPAEHVRHYRSEPDLQPPVVDVSGPEAGTTDPSAGPGTGPDSSPGMTAIGAKGGYGQKGPMLVDDAGDPVWFHPVTGADARDVQVQELDGEPVLTWWEGRQPVGYGYGHAVIVDQTYSEIARVDMAGGYDADSHEFHLTDRGTALMLSYEPVRMDTSHIGGWSRGAVVDNVIQEIDLATGAMLFEWHSVGQVGLEESYLDETYLDVGDEPYDYFHLNSIDVDDDGDLLISARHVCAAYKLDRETGAVRWRLGGTDSDFEMGDSARFYRQHDVRRMPDGTITLFDNGGDCADTREVSRGLALDVDEEAMTAEVAREVGHPEELWAESQANYGELPDGTAQLGWGSLPRWSLLDSDGEVLLDAAIPGDLRVTSYRAQRVEWTGTPVTSPRAVVAAGAVHVSWNGATEVAAWRVTDDGEEVATAERTGFETAVDLGDDVGRGGLEVEALDADGEVLATAPVGG